MSLPVIVLGAGSHSKVIVELMTIQAFNLLGITDNEPRDINGRVHGVLFLGGDDAVLQYPKDGVFLVNGLGSIKTTSKRTELFNHFKNLGYSFAHVIHPTAIIASDVRFSEGVQIMAGAILQTGNRLGKNVIINTGAVVDHDCAIGDHVHISPGVTLSGLVRVGEGVHVGAGATVVQGIKIGRGSIIGAGSVVVRDVPEEVTVVGVPARIIKSGSAQD